MQKSYSSLRIVDDIFHFEDEEKNRARFSYWILNVCAVLLYGWFFFFICRTNVYRQFKIGLNDRIVLSFFFQMCKTMTLSEILINIHEMNPRNYSQCVFHRYINGYRCQKFCFLFCWYVIFWGLLWSQSQLLRWTA